MNITVLVIAGPPEAQAYWLMPSHVYSIDEDMLACEGTTWIRGHHDEDSAEGAALLTTHVLTEA